MTIDEALKMLKESPDPEIQEAGRLWEGQVDWSISQFKIIHTVLDATGEKMSDLLVHIQYLAFDLEATRRERDELKGTQ